MNDSVGTSAAAIELRRELSVRLAEGRAREYGNVRREWGESAEQYFWDESHQGWRIDLMASHGVRPGHDRVLDLASGCGQFVLLALERGYDCEGLEPDAWRIEFARRKADLMGRPTAWKARLHLGVGESMPFADDSFDYATSFQTLEHVQDPRAVLGEMVRVVRPGGAIHIMCPDYRSTFEAHYQLPWLPLFPRPLARCYLRLLRRPTAGLDGLRYVTRPRILRWLRELETGKRFVVFDENRVLFDNALRRRGLPPLPGAFLAWRTWQGLRQLGRMELSVSLMVRVVRK